MTLCVTEVDVALPDREARARAARSGRKPMAEVALSLDNGRVREIVVPVRVGRILQEEGISLPQPEDDAFDAIHELEGRVCFSMLTEMLSRRDHSESEARRKLSAYGFRDQEIDGALVRAREARFLNDARFASYFIEERVRRGWGQRKVEAELRRRGVDLDSIPGYPEAFFSEDSDLERALALLERKRVPEGRPFEKLVRHLMGRGFSYGVAAEAARRRLEGDDDSSA